MPGPGELAEIAAAVADGAPLDWESLLDVSESQAVRDDVESLRLIARIAEVHGSSAWADRTEGPRTTGDPSSPHVDRPAGTTWRSLRLLERIGHGSPAVVASPNAMAADGLATGTVAKSPSGVLAMRSSAGSSNVSRSGFGSTGRSTSSSSSS